jgi:hypothetical protein
MSQPPGLFSTLSGLRPAAEAPPVAMMTYYLYYLEFHRIRPSSPNGGGDGAMGAIPYPLMLRVAFYRGLSDGADVLFSCSWLKFTKYILPLDSLYFRVVTDQSYYKAYIILRVMRGTTVCRRPVHSRDYNRHIYHKVRSCRYRNLSDTKQKPCSRGTPAAAQNPGRK